MDKVSFAHFYKHLEKQMDRVTQTNKPLMVTRTNANSIVVMSLEQFQSYQETAYLMASPKNAERLNEAITELSKNS